MTAKRLRKRAEFHATESHHEAVRALLRRLRGQLQSQSGVPEKCHESDSDIVVDAATMLASLPFAEQLQHMDTSLAQHDIPVVSRAYEESYLRGRNHDGEPQCAMGNDCECMMIDSKTRFVGVQFEIPSTTSQLSNNLCLLCLRKITLLLFYETIQKGINVRVPIQKYGNIPGQKNEYHPSAVLMCPNNGPIESMPLPIVAHQRNKLSVEVVGGVPHIRQHGVYMEDF